MESSKNVYRGILDHITKIYNHEKKINEKIIEIQRVNSNLIRNQRDLAKIVISIDKQQQRLINQMNFIANKLDKLEKDTDVIKEHQIKMSDNLQQNISAEHINVETFKVFKDEIMLGNKLNQDEINKIYDSINELDGYFHKFGDALDVVGRLVVDYLNDIRKKLGIIKKATSPVCRSTSPLAGSSKIGETKKLPEKTTFIPKAANVNEQIKDVILREINLAKASKDRIEPINKSDAKNQQAKDVSVKSASSNGMVSPTSSEESIQTEREEYKRLSAPKGKRKKSKTRIKKRDRSSNKDNLVIRSTNQLYNLENTDLNETFREMSVLTNDLNEIKEIRNTCEGASANEPPSVVDTSKESAKASTKDSVKNSLKEPQSAASQESSKDKKNDQVPNLDPIGQTKDAQQVLKDDNSKSKKDSVDNGQIKVQKKEEVLSFEANGKTERVAQVTEDGKPILGKDSENRNSIGNQPISKDVPSNDVKDAKLDDPNKQTAASNIPATNDVLPKQTALIDPNKQISESTVKETKDNNETSKDNVKSVDRSQDAANNDKKA